MKSKVTAALFAFFLGGYGAHKFYLGEKKRGQLYLIITLIGILTSIFLIGLIPVLVMGFIGFIDFVKLIAMDDSTFDSLYNNGEVNQNPIDPVKRNEALMFEIERLSISRIKSDALRFGIKSILALGVGFLLGYTSLLICEYYEIVNK